MEHFSMRLRFLLLLVCCAQVTVARAQTLAFPEAEGFGRYTTGARTSLAAASVYHVTNLNDSGPGSFRDAVSHSNRFVVFDVGGILNLNSVVPVASNITIAGQTAPGGITLYNNRISFTNSHNLISRHFAVRKGTASGREDTASIARGQNMIFDHMSITWGVDANFDINPDSGYVIDNITIQNSIVGQGLDNVGHSTGGLMQPGSGGSVSVIKSLYTDNVTRNPKVRDENEFINNVVYGWESNGYIMGDTSGSSWANVEGNYFIEGPIDGGGPFNSGTPTFNIYANDNWVDTNRNGSLDGTLVTNYPGSTVVPTRHAFPTTASLTAQQAVDYVMANAGPSIIRDAVDSRMMAEVASYGLSGGVIQRESDLFPGYGTNTTYLNPRARFTDADNDGMADNWELSRGLNPANAADWKGLNAGYTRLEEYVNELGATGTTCTSAGGAWTTPATWGGTVPTLADAASATGNLSIASGHGFARRLNVSGSLAVTGGTLDVFDTTTLDGTNTISGGTFTSGRVLLGSFGQTGSLEVIIGGTLQSGTVAAGGGAGSLALNGGTFRAGGAPDIKVPVSLGSAGGTIDTNGYSGTVTSTISGPGGLTKHGAGDLKLLNANSYAGPTTVTGGSLSATTSAALNSSSALELSEGTTLNVTSIAGGYVTGNGQTIGGAGQITGNLVTTTGSVLRPRGGEFVPTAHMVGIQAETMTLSSDWAVFDNAQHGTGAGGSYNGADLNGGGIVMLSNAGGSIPVATGVASTSVNIPVAGTWYLYARTVEPTVSPIPGDPATQPGGNNSIWTSAQAGTLQATTSNYEEVQTYANPGNAAVWNLVSPSISPLAGVATPINAGITYSLASGTQQFAVYGREAGTIVDAFVLSTTNLTAAQLDSVLAGTTVLGYSTGMAISGNYTQQANSLLQMQLSSSEQNTLLVGATANLAGNLSVELLDGFVPQPSDSFTILSAGNLVNTFAGLPAGSRVNTSGTSGSFVVNYDYANDRVTLSNFLAGIAGDFDGDGDVDGRDFLVWQRNPSVGSLSDWQTNYGASALTAASSAIPEPGTLVLTSLAVMGFLARRHGSP
jgi:autotransporter-associated beta strand protein